MEIYNEIYDEISQREWSSTITEKENILKISLTRLGDSLPNITSQCEKTDIESLKEQIIADIENYENEILWQCENMENKDEKIDLFYNGNKSKYYYLNYCTPADNQRGYVDRFDNYSDIARNTKLFSNGKLLYELVEVERNLLRSIMNEIFHLYLDEYIFLSEIKGSNGNKNQYKINKLIYQSTKAGIPVDIVQSNILDNIIYKEVETLREDLNVSFYRDAIPKIINV